MQRFINYLRDTRVEFKHVSWPSRSQALILTTFVIVVSLIVAFLLGALDYIFSMALDWIVLR